jgi:glycosyltransferase involved in cell wall biosynthesis
MKVTFVLPFYPWRPVGAFRVVYEYANQLVSRNHQITVVHARHTRDEEDFWAPRGLYRRLRRKAGDARDVFFRPTISWGKLDKRVRTLFVPEPAAAFVPNADAVIAGAWGAAPYVLRYPTEKGEKFHLLQHYAVTFGLPKAWVDGIWKAPMHNIVVSRWLGEIGMELGLNNLTVIPNGINSLMFRLHKPIEKRPKRIAMMYSTKEWKGSADGFKAIEIAKQRHADLEAVFFGIPPRPAQIPIWIEYLQNPPQEQIVEAVYNSSSIFLCASWLEGFALPPLEAMACGCAVVTTDCGGNRDYAEHDRTALVSSPRSPGELAANLCRILEDDNLRLRLALAANQHVHEFSWDRSADKLESLFYERVSAPSKAAPLPVVVQS